MNIILVAGVLTEKWKTELLVVVVRYAATVRSERERERSFGVKSLGIKVCLEIASRQSPISCSD